MGISAQASQRKSPFLDWKMKGIVQERCSSVKIRECESLLSKFKKMWLHHVGSKHITWTNTLTHKGLNTSGSLGALPP